MDRVQGDLFEPTGLLFELPLPLILGLIASGILLIETLEPCRFCSDPKRFSDPYRASSRSNLLRFEWCTPIP